MSFGEIIYRLPNETKTLIRHLEQAEKKRIKCKYALAFNITCRNEDILPKYTDIKVNPAVRAKRFTKNYRKQLVLHEIETKELELKQIIKRLETLREQLARCPLDACLKRDIRDKLDEVVLSSDHAIKVKTIEKLSALYGGPLMLPEVSDGYLNLSSVELTQSQKDLLNLGLNCHIQTIQTKYDSLEKKANLEMLYQDIMQLEQNKKVLVHEDLKTLLAAEGRKIRDSKTQHAAVRRASPGSTGTER